MGRCRIGFFFFWWARGLLVYESLSELVWQAGFAKQSMGNDSSHGRMWRRPVAFLSITAEFKDEKLYLRPVYLSYTISFCPSVSLSREKLATEE